METNFSTMDIEYQSVEAIQAYQEELLRKQMHYLAEHSPYYKRMFESFGIDIESIRTIDDLVRIPFTEKKDLQLYNEDFLCVPREEIIDYITTSGTLGDPRPSAARNTTCNDSPTTNTNRSPAPASKKATSCN